jgi:hypothetical protein
MARIVLIFASLFILLGCTKTSRRVESIGGDYYLESVLVKNTSTPSSGGYIRIYCKKDNREVEVARDVGGAGGIVNMQFEWKVYGSNLAYVAGKPGGSTLDRAIYVFSRQRGTNTMIDSDAFRYWKTSADESGITLHRYQHGEAVEDPQPVHYAADYLSRL